MYKMHSCTYILFIAFVITEIVVFCLASDERITKVSKIITQTQAFSDDINNIHMTRPYDYVNRRSGQQAQQKMLSQARGQLVKKIGRQSDTPQGSTQLESGTSERSTVNFQERPKFRPILSPYSINDLMVQIANNSTLLNMTVEVVAKTVEYNDIVLVKISEKDGAKKFRTLDSAEKYVTDVKEKKVVLIVHGLNVEGMMNVPCLVKVNEFEKLLSYYTKYLDKFDIYLVPIANPDGLAQSVEQRHWGKNYSPQEACPGVYLDRNFNVAWNEAPKLSSCHPWYPGPSAFSERESRAIRDIIHLYNSKIIAYINVHANNPYDLNFKGEYVLYPKGYVENSEDDDKYIDLKGELDEMLRNLTISTLPVDAMSLYQWYGKVHGTSVDYASKVYGIPYALELAMQPYDENFQQIVYTKYILEDVWKKIIDLLFKTFVKSLAPANNVKK